MPSVLDLLLRNSSSLTPRLENLKESQNLEDLDFTEGEVNKPQPPELDDAPVGTASIIRELFGPEVDIRSGVAETEDSAGWYEVNFRTNFEQSPIVVAMAEHREGGFNTKSYSAPSHGAPRLSFNSNRISLENTFEANFKESSRAIGKNMYEQGKTAFESFLPTIVGVDLSDPFVDAWNFLMINTWGEGKRENDNEGAVESVFGAIGEFVGKQIDQAINEKADEIQDAVGVTADGLSELNTPIQESYSSLTGQAEKSLNDSPRLLWESMGMPEGAMMTPVNVRNIDESGFEVLGVEGGMTVQWVAVG